MAQGCGLASRDAPISEATGGSGAPAQGGRATGGAASSVSGGAGTASVAAGSPDAIELDASDCATRLLSDCVGIETEYDSNSGFEDGSHFAQCDIFNSFDGCGALEFSFDAQGCANSVSGGPGGWKNSGHLSLLRDCLRDALQSARFPCLASAKLRYDESCFVR